jgi:hypothetical protein
VEVSRGSSPKIEPLRPSSRHRVFISYRRKDTAGHAGRLYDSLAARLGEERVFMDIDKFEPGVDFVEAVENAVQSCGVVIAPIGRHWMGESPKRRHRGSRLDNPNDFVRLEIEGALRAKTRIIPVPSRVGFAWSCM